jgi:hypothetical protein
MKLPITITKKRKTFTVEFDLDRWEKVANALGLFTNEFIEDIEAAEAELERGEVYEIKSFRDLED